MKKIFGLLILSGCAMLQAQTITQIQIGDNKYEVCDMTGKDRITWGGYTQVGSSATSTTNGDKNTIAIVSNVGGNVDHDGKPYAAKECNDLEAGGNNDWYLPALDEMKGIFDNNKLVNLPASNTYWTSTEASGTQAQTVYFYSGAVYQVAKSRSVALRMYSKSEVNPF